MMKFDDLQKELLSDSKCPVLVGHFSNLFGGVHADNIEGEPSDILSRITPVLWNDEYVLYADKFRDSMREKFSIPEDKFQDMINMLEMNGRVYILYSLMPLASKNMNSEFKRLREISTAAKKLRELLPDEGDELLTLLSTLNNIELRNMERNDISIFMKQLKQYLSTIEIWPETIPKTNAAKLLKVGIKTAKGKMSLHILVASYYELWTGFLGRNFEYDGPKGVSGRTRFIEFIYEFLLPIHQSIQFETVKNAVRTFDEIRKTEGDGLLTS